MRPVHEQIAARAAADPGAPAVVAPGRSLTYGELDSQADRLAHTLRGLGVGPEVIVALLTPRAPEAVVAALAVAKAGGAYLPLDPAYPEERLLYSATDAGARVLVTTAALSAAFPALGAACGATLLLDRDRFGEPAPPAPLAPLAPLAPTAGLGNLAYVIYTSGSTGRPKGVEIEHRGLANLVAWHLRIYDLGPGDRTTRLAGASFDAAVWEIWPCLAAGACLYLPPDDVLLAPARLLAWLAEHRITQTFLPTPLAEAVLEEPWPAGAALEVMLTGGDRLHRGPGPDHTFALANHYGPTEATVCTTWTIVEPESGSAHTPPPIGLPVDGATVHLLDRDLQPMPEGEPGELLVGGLSLARGYRNRPDWTAERFVPNPWGKPGERLYRSGDRVRELPSGDLDFVGRIDHQVKIRGYRIELGEIEAVLRSHPGVREGVVLAPEEGDERRLVGYAAGRSGAALDPKELRTFLGRTLPEPMVPAAWIFLAALPLTPNGKVDRRALASRVPLAVAERVAPAGPVEERLAAIYGEVLGVERVGALDDFFALGGHSLKATQVLTRVRAALGVELAVAALYDHPTVAALARRVKSALAGIEAGIGDIGGGEIQPRPCGQELEIPLSYAQQELWFIERWAPGTPAYNTPMEVALTGPLDAAALGLALAEIVRRHEVLRTVYPDLSGRPVQRLLPAATAAVRLGRIDLAGLPSGKARAVAGELASEEGRRPFDLERGPVLRTFLLRLGPTEHRLLFLLHHIVSDDWTVSLLLSDLAALYRAFAAGRPSPLPEPRLQYADFAIWQRGFLAGAVREKLLAYWRQRLASAPMVLELPADRPRPAGFSFVGSRLSAALPIDLVGQLGALARKQEASLFMVLLAGWSALLGRYTGEDDLLLGSPSANRNRLELESLAGLFIHTLVLRARLTEASSGAALVAQLRETTLGAYAHQDLPFQQLVDALEPARDPSRHPMVQVFFVFGNAPLPPRELAPGVGLAVSEVDAGVAKVDLSLYVQEEQGRLALQWEYPTALFDRATVERFHGHFRTLLAGLAAAPEIPVSALPLLAPAERRQLARWNAESARRPLAGGTPAGEETLAGLFAEQAARTPGATALVVGLTRLTYGDLAARVDRLARRLAAQGVGPEVGVALFLPRTADLVIAMLATLAAGGFYVPLDPAYPAARLAFLLSDSSAAVLVTTGALAPAAPAGAARTIRLDGPEAALPSPLSMQRARPANLAYLIYTSGSTGRPKAVAITHASASLLVRWAQGVFSEAERSAVLAATSIAFDLSVFEIFLPLSSGGTVILADNVLALAELPARAEVTLVNTVPSALAELLRLGALPPSVRTVNLAGEALPRALADQVHALPGVERLYNLYGPSEDTTYSTFAEVERQSGRTPGIGRPIAGTSAYVLGGGVGGGAAEPLPVGVPGELYLGGAGLARGYLGRPELTAERFVLDPFSGGFGARLYRTGDLVRRRPAGELDFLGRRDQQVKVRGFRIELGEVESALAACPGVAAAAVLARRDGALDLRLVAYIAPETLSAAALRSALEQRLPHYMIPALWVFLPSLPQTPNGKLDRRALPAPRPERPEAESAYRAPCGRVERILAEVWAEVLGLPRVGVLDNFFALGGDSILTIQVVARCRERGLEVVPRQIFRHQTVASLAAVTATVAAVAAVPTTPPIPSLPPVAPNEAASFPQADLSREELADLLAGLD
jgi:amino acid adenylation domain-containing protein